MDAMQTPEQAQSEVELLLDSTSSAIADSLSSQLARLQHMVGKMDALATRISLSTTAGRLSWDPYAAALRDTPSTASRDRSGRRSAVVVSSPRRPSSLAVAGTTIAQTGPPVLTRQRGAEYSGIVLSELGVTQSQLAMVSAYAKAIAAQERELANPSSGSPVKKGSTRLASTSHARGSIVPSPSSPAGSPLAQASNNDDRHSIRSGVSASIFNSFAPPDDAASPPRSVDNVSASSPASSMISPPPSLVSPQQSYGNVPQPVSLPSPPQHFSNAIADVYPPPPPPAHDAAMSAMPPPPPPPTSFGTGADMSFLPPPPPPPAGADFTTDHFALPAPPPATDMSFALPPPPPAVGQSFEQVLLPPPPAMEAASFNPPPLPSMIGFDVPVPVPVSAPVAAPPPPPAVAPAPVAVQFAQALYAYAAVEEDEISLRAGDVIQVLQVDAGEGWTLGICVQSNTGNPHVGRSGLFPRAYVQLFGS
ncbi:Protein BZZ1 [Sorochytrium milnesiophthora]